MTPTARRSRVVARGAHAVRLKIQEYVTWRQRAVDLGGRLSDLDDANLVRAMVALHSVSHLVDGPRA